MATDPLHVIGTIHPPATSEKKDADDLTKAEMVMREKDLVGRPVLVEHQGAPVGDILTTWINENTGSLKMAANIVHPDVQTKIKNGDLRGLSIGSTLIHPVGTDPSARLTHILNEVSVCEQQRRDGCLIDHVDYQPVLEVRNASKSSSNATFEFCNLSMTLNYVR